MVSKLQWFIHMIAVLLLLQAFTLLETSYPNSTIERRINRPNDSLYASIQFDTKLIEHYNFCEGEIQTYSYRFKNTGKVPLVITQVRSGCGCYVPYWTKEPIMPGDSGTVSGRYSSLYRPGPFRRSLTVFFKDDLVPRQMLHVKGYTVPRAICR